MIHPAGGPGAIVQTPPFGREVDGALDDEGRVRQRIVHSALGDEDGALALGGRDTSTWPVPCPLMAVSLLCKPGSA
jgi:hypothetical protein